MSDNLLMSLIYSNGRVVRIYGSHPWDDDEAWKAVSAADDLLRAGLPMIFGPGCRVEVVDEPVPLRVAAS